MLRRSVQVLGLIVLGAALGWGQTYGPGEIYYGGIRLQFFGRLVTAGTCAQPTQPGPGITEVRCQVTEGSSGTLELTATRTPAGAVNIRIEAVPSGWPGSLWIQHLGQWVDSRNPVASAWGTVTAQYRFTVPAGSAGGQFTLRFKAWTAGVVGELELRVVLDVVRATTPTEPTVPPSYGPFMGTTDASGRFEVPIPSLPNTSVTGTLTECTVRVLPRAQVSVTLVPKLGVTTISRADQIGAVRVSSPGYSEVETSRLQLASSMDMFGRVSTTVDVGTVCLRPTGPATPPPPAYGPITGTTDAEGRFTGTLAPGVTVTGRLTECTVKPLPSKEFTLTPVPKGEVIASPEDIAGFTFSVPGYAETTLTQFSTLSLLGWTSYILGDVCLVPPCTLIIRGRVDDGGPHGAPAYPVSKSKVWLFVLEEGDHLPLAPLSDLARQPTAETSTNHTDERSFDGTEFRRVEEARYEFRLQWTKPCPPRIVVVSLLCYDEQDLMAVSSENLLGGRLVPVYLAKVVSVSGDPYLPHYGTASAVWQKTGPNEYIATVDFSYGRDPLAGDSTRVIGVAGREMSEEWDRKGVDPDVFMRNCAHFYFYSYKAMRYFEHLGSRLGVGLKPVAVSMFAADGRGDPGTSCSPGDVPFGRLAGGPQVVADARAFISAPDSTEPTWGGEKPDNSIWHELGHYWWLQIYGSFTPYAVATDENHGGYANSNTSDSVAEGFAEFTSMLTAEHYGDHGAFRYRVGGNNHNLEVDLQLWGPDREEYAIAGLLWDLHDGGGLEPKPLGTISTVIATRDHVSLSDVEIFGIFVDSKPTTLKGFHDAFMAIPPYGTTDTDWDGVPDVRELFVAHGAFEDIRPTNQKWDGGDEIIGFGGMAGRPKSPPLAQAYLLIRLVDSAGRAVPVDQATMRVEMRFADPFAYYDYQDERPLWSERVYFVMPTNFYQVSAFITVEVPGVGRSAPLEITAQQYWELFQQAGEAGLDYLFEHTFVLGG
ncbi:hypothetical protein H5T54_06445 [Candidatus Bipolaricaulota bacterium]|nr:hypothetical protein [Candidatus Bipolaricaulota bacterium]